MEPNDSITFVKTEKADIVKTVTDMVNYPALSTIIRIYTIYKIIRLFV